jgi:hypothetical protein
MLTLLLIHELFRISSLIWEKSAITKSRANKSLSTVYLRSCLLIFVEQYYGHVWHMTIIFWLGQSISRPRDNWYLGRRFTDWLFSRTMRTLSPSEQKFLFHICPFCTSIGLKGTVSRDWDGLFVVWMDRALFGDELLIVFMTIYCFLVFNFELLSPEVLHKGCPFVCNWATLWQIPQRILVTFANSTYLPEGCQHSLILRQRVLITLQSNFQRVLDIAGQKIVKASKHQRSVNGLLTLEHFNYGIIC